MTRKMRSARYSANQRAPVNMVNAGSAQLAGSSAHNVKFRLKPQTNLPRLCPRVDTFTTNFCAPMRYAFTRSTATEGSGAVISTFELNSLFDPYVGTGGGQPKYFTTLCGVDGYQPYDTYTVTKAHVRITFVNRDSTSPVLFYAQVYSDTAGVAPNCPIYEYGETPNLFRELAGPINSPTAIQVLEFDVDIGDFLGVGNILSEDNCQAQYNANPGRGVYLDIGARDSITDVGGLPFSITVEIVFDTVFQGLVDALPSLTVAAPVTNGAVTVSRAVHNITSSATGSGGAPVRASRSAPPR